MIYCPGRTNRMCRGEVRRVPRIGRYTAREQGQGDEFAEVSIWQEDTLWSDLSRKKKCVGT